MSAPSDPDAASQPEIAIGASNRPEKFGAPFWYTYAANTAMMMAVSLLYRYADFVMALGGDELLLGWIIGLGMVGSLAVRTLQGQGIDRYGARRIWLLSAAGFVVACLGHLTVDEPAGPGIFFWRTLLQTSISGFFGASISYISGRNSAVHMAEVIGTLGTSGFLGTLAGTCLGDQLLGAGGHYERMFLVAAAIGSLACLFGWLATDGARRPRTRRSPNVALLVRRYHPGYLLLMGVAAGFGLGLPTIFLRPYAIELGIPELGTFFYPYMLVAFVTRLSIRRLPALIGIRPMVMLGLANMVIGTLAFVVVSAAWHLFLPALFMGVAHACMFPAVVAGGSVSFPQRYRGLGTTLLLAMFDLGNLVGQPTFGAVWDVATHFGLSGFRVAFVTSAGLLALSGIVYVVMTHPARTAGRQRARARVAVESAEIEIAS